jgi:RES domain-containing protein
MRFWRISNFADLNGTGGMAHDSRWSLSGRPVVYLADHPSTSLLEILVHIDRTDAPVSYQLLRVDGPYDVSLTAPSLSEGWQENIALTQELGTAFLDEGKHALLRVPSAIMPQAFNYLLNPNHPDAAKLTVAQIWRYPFDSRLLM